ncbi:TrmH family RNA methyltransferase [Arenibacter algicola]|uniref:tRNA (guanosine(18)-2'-O)-methyltransferase n=1 Tax=Arenibacter algicola TaxID=616991 RepID=A0A221V420_9FLAO|nr:RNA methyltransferase [Arenibacter algicola]ASO08116.1 tRNA (guanosine(18)-2'-O)-methyltransferase [Arenibacter algicola]|tara:strand:- start:142 stop:798 length:657 start_codon:yes stop_codon:yes gene_type:complete
MVDLKLLDYLEGFITPERKARFLDILEDRTNYITVAIEDVYQMHNTSAVVRSCDVFGVQQAHLIESKFGKRLDKDIAMGAQQWVDIKRYNTTTDCIDTLREQEYKIVATTPHRNNCSLTDFKLEGKTALFFGTERDGLSEEVLEKADSFLKIPMVGFTESLNISVSAAIILHTLTSQLRKESINWRLTEEEKLEKRLDWTKKSVRSLNDVLARFHGTK